jgi:hypothetical protein
METVFQTVIYMFHADNIITGDAELSIETAERLSETWERKRRY